MVILCCFLEKAPEQKEKRDMVPVEEEGWIVP